MLDYFSLLDWGALAWFLICWFGYTIYADHGARKRLGVSRVMDDYRLKWMLVMTRRENRVVDSTIMNNLLYGSAFFASTSIIVIGGLLASLGASDQVAKVLTDMPFAIETSRASLETKILVMVALMIFAFFKFAWSFRLFNYCSVMIGAVPLETEDAAEREDLAKRTAQINGLAAGHFNIGLRAYFFALALLSWFLHPALFIIASAWVVCVLQRRDFRSRSLRAARGELK